MNVEIAEKIDKINQVIEQVEKLPASLECINAVIDMLNYEKECICNNN